MDKGFQRICKLAGPKPKLKSKVELEVTTQSTSSSALQAFPYSDAIMKRPE